MNLCCFCGTKQCLIYNLSVNGSIQSQNHVLFFFCFFKLVLDAIVYVVFHNCPPPLITLLHISIYTPCKYPEERAISCLMPSLIYTL